MKILHKQSGFGLLEALIASGILVILASVSVGSSTVLIKNTTSFNNKIVAANLAESGIEAAYAVRDEMVNDNKPATDWSYGFSHTTSGASIDCSSGCGLVMDEANLSFGTSKIVFGGTSDTISRNEVKFVRKLYFTLDSSDSNIVNIRSQVLLEGGTDILADISTQLTNWKETRL